MAGLSKIREHAASQFRQANIKELLKGKKAILIDMGSVNAIATHLVTKSQMTMMQVLSWALRWLKGVVLPRTSSDTPIEVTVRTHNIFCSSNESLVWHESF